MPCAKKTKRKTKFAAAEANKSKRKDVECFDCKREGHYKTECWAKGGDDEGGETKTPQDLKDSRRVAAALVQIATFLSFHHS
jgi:hypothetical protein